MSTRFYRIRCHHVKKEMANSCRAEYLRKKRINNCNGLFTAATQFRWVLSRLDPVSNLQLISGSHRRQRPDKTVLSCLQLCSHCRWGQDKTVLSCQRRRCEHNWRHDKTVLSCPCRRCEQAIKKQEEVGTAADRRECEKVTVLSVTVTSCKWWRRTNPTDRPSSDVGLPHSSLEWLSICTISPSPAMPFVPVSRSLQQLSPPKQQGIHT